MSRDVKKMYDRWLENAINPDVQKDLKDMRDNEEEINDSFYRDLAFGTGGLRGVIGAGTNRMNIYTVAKATQGVANYFNKKNPDKVNSVAISYDSRINSDVFSRVTAAVFASNGFEVHLYPELMPVPACSFAVRELGCDTGVMITASHNPAKYNGYKVYGADGCQIKTQVASDISDEINSLDIFNDIKPYNFKASLNNHDIKYIPEEVYVKYIENVKSQTMLTPDTTVNKDLKIIYSPLNGTGLKPVTRILEENGFSNITVVEEQREPNGHFPTCPYPNPEIPEAMALGVKYAKEEDADIFLATDPDADRCGMAIKNDKGEFELVSGNLIGALLLNYICERRTETGRMPENPVFVKSIVTTSLAERIADSYGVETVNVLTGFKYIGDQILKLEEAGRESDYIFGYEESYGYLSGTYVRDKDAVNGAMLIAEMFAYYKTRGVSLFDKIAEIFDKYGYTLDTLHAYQYEGQAGYEKMNQIMQDLRQDVDSLGGLEVSEILDYNKGVRDLPKSDVIQYNFGENGHAIVRPSGTEPKIKVYISLKADRDKADALETAIREDIEKLGNFAE